MEFGPKVRYAALGAILVVAAVAYIVASSYLNSLNGFMTVSSCTAVAPYLCSEMAVNSSGLVRFTFVQNSGKALYNVELACLMATNSLFSAPTSNEVQYVPLADISEIPITLNLTTGQQIPVASLPCYQNSGLVSPRPSVGPALKGEIYINYTNFPGKVGAPQNPWVSSMVATIYLEPPS